MTDVIKIEGYEEFKDLVRVENGDIAVSVREFHRLLGIKWAFTEWFKYQCEKLKFVEGKDYILLSDFQKQTGRGGHNKIDYITSLYNGKHLCMISQGDMAYRIRDYFIKVEKEWNNPDSVINRAIEMSPSKVINRMSRDIVMAKALQISNEIMKEQEAKHKAELEARDVELEAQKPMIH